MIILAAYLIGALMFAPLLWKMSGKAAESNERTGTVPAGAVKSLRFWFLVLMAAVWPLMVLVMIVGAFRKARRVDSE